MQYQLSNDEYGTRSLVVFGVDGTRTATRESCPEFDRVVAGLLDGSMTEREVFDALEPGKAIQDKFNQVTDRIRYRDGDIFFDGELVRKPITRHMLAKLQQGDPEWENLVRFMDKLASNPNPDSRKFLYKWVELHGMTITRDGDIIGYKGVRNDGTSVHSGYGIVDGKVYEDHHLPHEVGSVVEFPRSMVDADRSQQCSIGLHVGTFKYARGFAERLLTVVVNPRDVVSVPDGNEWWKFRCCRYVVKELAPGRKYEHTTIDWMDDDDDDWDDDDDNILSDAY